MRGQTAGIGFDLGCLGRIRRSLRFAWESGPGLTVASMGLVFCQGVLPLAALGMIGLTVDSVAAAVSRPHDPAALRRVMLLVGLAGAIALVSLIIDILAGIVRDEHAEAVTDTMHNLLHSKAIEADLEYYESTEYHDHLDRAQQEVYRPIRVLRALVQLGQSAIVLIGILGLLISLHLSMAVVLFIALIPCIIVRGRFVRDKYQWARGRTSAERRAGYFNYLLTLNDFAKEIRLFGSGPLFQSRFRDLRRQIRRERRTLVLRRSRGELLAQTSAILPVFGSCAFIAYQAAQGAITLGGLVLYYQALQRSQTTLQSILNGLVGLYEDSLYLANLYQFLDLKPKVAEPVHPMGVPRPMQEGIVLHQVGFRYPASPRRVLEEINLTIRPGEIVALVGENGSGKTTLVKLLCRLYDPTAGTLTLDGTDLRRFKTADLRREISVVFQDYVKYHLTARENIWLGNLELPSDDEKILVAARRSGAGELLADLKNGYDTVLGKYFPGGEELSIGEWQKVALARAFVRDAQLLVLDEPTSALDPQAESEVFDQFRQLIEGRSALLISHRLSTVKMADRIYVLKDGRIAESGTHVQLLRKRGAYARLFELQARNYR